MPSTTTMSCTSTRRVDPSGDIETVNTELILADLQTVEQRLPKLVREAKGKPELKATVEAVATAERLLSDGRTISSAAAAGEVDVGLLGDLHLLTAKPFIYVFNVDEGALGDAAATAALGASVAPAPAIVLCAQIEAEVAGLDLEDAGSCCTATARRSRASSNWCTWASPPSDSRPS